MQPYRCHFSKLLPRFRDGEERTRITGHYARLVMVPAFDESALWIISRSDRRYYHEHTLAITLRIDWPSRTYTLNARSEPQYRDMCKQLDGTICDDYWGPFTEYTLNENYELVRKGAYGRLARDHLYITADHKLRCLGYGRTKTMESTLRDVSYLAGYDTPPSKVNVGALPPRLTELFERARSQRRW